MPMQVEAVYENGVLRPLEPLGLAEHQHVTVTVTESTTSADRTQLDSTFVEKLRKDLQAAPPAPGLEEVRRRLSKIPGSIAADFIAEREDR
jgi:predicted DNA-binding antitoxin AbrB/MazE fold protein